MLTSHAITSSHQPHNMIDLYDNLSQGDDISYADGTVLQFGRISSVGDTSYTLLRYRLLDEPSRLRLPSPSSECLSFDELFLTTSTVLISKSSVRGIVFVLSKNHIDGYPLTFASMSNVYLIRYKENDDDETQLTEILQWEPFPRTFPLSIPLMIFRSLEHVRSLINGKLKARKQSQLGSTSFSTEYSPICFGYLKTKAQLHMCYFEKSDRVRTKKITRSDLTLLSKQKTGVLVQVLQGNTPAAIEFIKEFFGLIAVIGVKTKHPSSKDIPETLQEDTACNVLTRIIFTYTPSDEILKVQLTYDQIFARDLDDSIFS
jgi:hypothetical protein